MTIVNTKITDDLEAYILSVSSGLRDVEREIYMSSVASGKHYMQVSLLQSTILRFLINAFCVDFVVEVGAFYGFSSSVMYNALPSASQLHTFEIEREYCDRAEMSFEKIRTTDKILRCHHTDAKDLFSGNYFDINKIGLFFLDGDKLHYPEYISWAISALPVGAILVMDNVLFKGEVLDKGSEIGKAIHRANELLSNCTRIQSCYIPVGDCMYIGKMI